MTVDPAISVPPSRPRRRWPYFVGAAVLIIGGITGTILYKRAELRRYNWAPIALPERLARVPADWSAATLSERLQRSHKIRDAASFREAAEEVDLKSVQPGGYLLPKIAGPLELAKAFKNGPTHETVTFPEGFTVAQIAARLEKNGFTGGLSLAKMPVANYEGRLFPDTYLLPLKAPAQDLAGRLEARFAEEVRKLPRPFPKIGDKPMTEMEVVTLASLVEREAASSSEMPLIAGVMVGRLRHPMRLQIDASVQYARTISGLEHKPRLLFADLKIDSPYNTYLHAGLPPAPICNPGAAALAAAARPAATTSLFYVYSPKTKHHLFAATFEQHKHNIAVARLEREALDKAAIEKGITLGHE